MQHMYSECKFACECECECVCVCVGGEGEVGGGSVCVAHVVWVGVCMCDLLTWTCTMYTQNYYKILRYMLSTCTCT